MNLGLSWKATPLRFSHTLDVQTGQDGAGFFQSSCQVLHPNSSIRYDRVSKAQRETLLPVWGLPVNSTLLIQRSQAALGTLRRALLSSPTGRTQPGIMSPALTRRRRREASPHWDLWLGFLEEVASQMESLERGVERGHSVDWRVPRQVFRTQHQALWRG